MSNRRGRQRVIEAVAPVLLGTLILGIVLILGYVFVVKRFLGGLTEERRNAEAYARSHIETKVLELRDPSGMWKTVPVEFTIYNSGRRDLLELTISVTFLDEDDKVVWSEEVTQEIELPAGDERAVVWKFMIGGRIGSDVELANRIRRVEIVPVRARTRGTEETAPSATGADPAPGLS